MAIRSPGRSTARPDRSDAELVEALRGGDAGALGILFDRHGAALGSFLARAFGPEIEVEDLVQQTFVEVWRKVKKFRGRSAVRTWIFGIGANLARNHSRGLMRRLLALASYGRSQHSRPPVRTPSQIVEQRERLARFEAAIASLPEDLRIAFVMCEIECVPGAEAAEALGVRPGTIWRRLHDARRRLAARLEDA
jgi:RNA polymerase sigma-70 factor (ECF subfamily)